MDEIKQKPLSKPEVYMMSWNEKYQLDNKLLCLQAENAKLKKVIEILKKYFGLVEYEEFEEYNIFTNDGYFVLEITKEEYDLLKEVFGK